MQGKALLQITLCEWQCASDSFATQTMRIHVPGDATCVAASHSRGGTFLRSRHCVSAGDEAEDSMHQLIYLVVLIVIILAILSFFGLR